MGEGGCMVGTAKSGPDHNNTSFTMTIIYTSRYLHIYLLIGHIWWTGGRNVRQIWFIFNTFFIINEICATENIFYKNKKFSLNHRRCLSWSAKIVSYVYLQYTQVPRSLHHFTLCWRLDIDISTMWNVVIQVPLW